MGHTRRVSNININERINHFILLLIVILMGLFISTTMNGRRWFHKEKEHLDKKENYIIQKEINSIKK